MIRRTTVPVLVTAALLAGCGGDAIGPITELPRALTAAESDLIAADNRFAFKLLEAVAAGETGPNLFISPLSVGMALGMTYNGAAGETEVAMRQALELGGLTLEAINASYRGVIDLLRGLDPSVEFTIANSLWHRAGVTPAPDFLERVSRHFDANITGLDFASPTAAPTINAWVDDRTGGRIREIVEAPIDAATIAFLINAIYFKGSWTHRFDPDRTAPWPFQLANGSERDVPLMRSDGEIPVRYARVNDVDVLDLPYGGGAFRMTIVLPETPETLADLVARTTAAAWTGWTDALDSADLVVALPKFSLSYEQSLNDELEALGMAIAFSCDDPPVADFSAMVPGGGVCLTEVKHKTFVDVNEVGTEAAAATSVGAGVVSAPPSVEVDRPFVFAIREALSGTILFLGVIGDPGA
jgi:serpin B